MKERRSDGVKSCHHCHHYNFEKFVSKLKREGNTLELPSPFGRVRAHDFFFFICSVRFLFAAFRLFAVGIFYLQRSFLFAAYLFLFAAYFFICSVHFLFAAYIFYLQRTFFICSVLFFICSVLFLFAAFLFCLQRFFFVCSVSFLFAAFLFCLQRFFFVCSVSFLFAAFLFCLQRFFFVCSMSLVGHRRLQRDSHASFCEMVLHRKKIACFIPSCIQATRVNCHDNRQQKVN